MDALIAAAALSEHRSAVEPELGPVNDKLISADSLSFSAMQSEPDKIGALWFNDSNLADASAFWPPPLR